MKQMPNQNPLPFPGEEPPKTPDATSSSPATVPSDGAAAPVPPVAGAPAEAVAVDAEPAAIVPSAIVPGTRAPSGRPPWWARLLGRLVEPWLSLKIEPEHPGQYNDGRPVVYVLEDYGLSNALILDKACREAGLPSPLVPIAGDPTGRRRAYLALSRRSSSNSLIPEQRGAKTHSDSLAKVLQAHRARGELDVNLVPVSIFVVPTFVPNFFPSLFAMSTSCLS
jgi:glycerol-3-phosphate O-acyltransferase